VKNLIENLKVKENLGEVSVDRTNKLTRILKKLDGSVWTYFMWLREGSI
jgi:hypothetical protein